MKQICYVIQCTRNKSEQFVDNFNYRLVTIKSGDYLSYKLSRIAFYTLSECKAAIVAAAFATKIAKKYFQTKIVESQIVDIVDISNSVADESIKTNVNDFQDPIEQSVYLRLKQLVSEFLGCPEAEIYRHSRFIRDLGADSLDCVELVMAVEDDWGFEMIDEEAEVLLSVEQAVQYITMKIRNK